MPNSHINMSGNWGPRQYGGGGVEADSFTPLRIPGLQLWLKADAGLTLSIAGYTGTGTTVAQSGNTLTGVATKFLSEVVIGDNITGAGGLNGNVTAIASDTSLTLDSSATIGAETPYTITPVAGTSNRVTTWADQSGNGYDATQVTATKKPFQKLAIKNGKAIIRFNGTSHELTHSYGVPSNSAFTAFAVAYRNVGAAGYQGILNSLNAPLLARLNASANWGTYENADIDSQQSINGAFKVICTVRRAYNDIDLVTNGVVSNQTNGASTYTSTPKAIGSNIGSQYFAGDLGELLLYNSALSVANRQQVESYLNSRWAIY